MKMLPRKIKTIIQKEKDQIKKKPGQDQNFLDMYESGDNSYKDVGIKRMKRYKCNLYNK